MSNVSAVKGGTEKLIKEIKSIDVKGSNEHDVQKVQSIVDGAVRKAEIKAEHDLELKKLEQEYKEMVAKMEDNYALRKLECETKYKIVDNLTSTLLWAGAIGGYTAAVLMNKNIQLEKVKSGQF